MNDTSIKVPPTECSILNADGKAAMPGERSCVMQLAQVHELYNSELNYKQHQHNLSMRMLRNREGIAAPLVMSMNLYAARKVQNFPFMPSSRLMEDVITGRTDMIDFDDYLGLPEYDENLRNPHAIMEKSLGIL